MGGPETTAMHDTPIVIVGGGPVGMLTALNLSRFGVQCLLAERSLETTKWPKMDLTNCRTMEIFRMMGIADEYRALDGAVGGNFKMHSLFYHSVAPGSELITSWQLPSINEWRESIFEHNDGTQPAEPGQRCSQIVLEAWLKTKCTTQLSIESHFGWKYLTHVETSDGVYSTFIDTNDQEHVIHSQYLVGADGGSSSVRKTAGIKMFGAQCEPSRLFHVHFRSQELSKSRPFGRFWHMFPPVPGFIIDQDEGDTFTAHMVLDSPDQDVSKIDPREWVYRVLGGAGEPYRFKIDEVLVSSAWRPNFAIAEHYLSPGGRVILAGDACHRNPPHGGLGMNTGVEDALAVSWRLSALVKGYGGSHLLDSYESEHRPVMIQRLERCFEHVGVHGPYYEAYAKHGSTITADTPEGVEIRAKLKAHFDSIGPEVLDRGIELDSRYKSSVIYSTSDDGPESAWEVKEYTPSTYPGSRAPHVFLRDGKRSIFDTFGPEWSLVTFLMYHEANRDFMENVKTFLDVAVEMGVPLQNVTLEDEGHARDIWGYTFVLVRADGHVAWRGQNLPKLKEGIRGILRVVTGRDVCRGYVQSEVWSKLEMLQQEYPERGPVVVREKV